MSNEQLVEWRVAIDDDGNDDDAKAGDREVVVCGRDVGGGWVAVTWGENAWRYTHRRFHRLSPLRPPPVLFKNPAL
jgi:hypothetical protein